MIVLENVSKAFWVWGKKRTLFQGINLTIPTGLTVGLLGRNGAGKSTLLRMLAGTMDLTEGRILTDGLISWPVGFAGSFHGDLTGNQNVKFIARIYGMDTDEMSDFVEDFADLGDHFHMPFRTYSSGMKSRLAFGASMAVPFDTYLIDEVTSVGDAAFRKKSTELFKDRLKTAGAFYVSHNLGTVRTLCESGMVIDNGQVTWHDDIETALDHHAENMEKPRS